jgi:hypothetical protein
MIGRLLDRLVKYYEEKCRKRYDGELIMWVVYKPDQSEPNVIFNVHPDLRTVLINDKCKELAAIVRQEWNNRGGDINV